MIVKNEEKFLEQCLKSVDQKVDEIIIVDTGSTDSTVNIAEKYNAKIFSFEWVDDFSIARNFSLEQATSQYILVMDADEYLDEATDLAKVIETDKDFYMIRTKNHLTNGNAYFHPSIRLFKNHVGLRYRGKIHEHLNVEDPSLNLTDELGDVLLHHVGYLAEVVQEKNKHDRNIKLLLEEVEKNPSGYNFFNLGNQYAFNSQLDEAVNAYKKAFNLSKDRAYINTLLYNMAECLINLKRYEEAIDVLNGCTESFPMYTDFYFLKGRVFEELDDYIDAEEMFKKCVQLGEVKFIQSKDGVGSFQSYVRLGNIYASRGELVQGFDMGYEALKVSKHYLPALRLYLEAMIRSKITQEDIEKQLELIYPIQDFEDLKSMVIGLSVIKSPIAIRYIQKYQLKVDPSVINNALLYSKQYEEPRKYWNSKKDITQSELYDIAFLAFILKDIELLNPFIQKFNFNQKDQKFLKNMIVREKLNFQKASKNVENVVQFIFEQLIKLEEFEQADYFLGKLAELSFDFRLSMCRTLFFYGYFDVTLEILLADFPNHSSSSKLLEMLGDVCVRKKQYEEAKSFYSRSLEIDPKYKIYEKLYFLGKKMEDEEFQNIVVKEIKKDFPLVEWTKRLD